MYEMWQSQNFHSREISSGRHSLASRMRADMDVKKKQKTLRLLTNGMYIVTSRSGDRFAASTITWATQASFAPPLIMVAIRHESNVLRCMKESRVAVFHI